MAGWMKMPLGTEVDLGPGHNALDGVQLLRKGHSSPPFRPMSAVATVAHLSYCWALVDFINSTRKISPEKNAPSHLSSMWNIVKCMAYI